MTNVQKLPAALLLAAVACAGTAAARELPKVPPAPPRPPGLVSEHLGRLAVSQQDAARNNRPRVFMAMHGSNALANNASLDGQWTYVREHLDGIFANNAGVDPDEQAALYRKIATRNIVSVAHLNADPSFTEAARWSAVQKQNPDIVLQREGVFVYTGPGDASFWNNKTVADARVQYVTGADIPDWLRYDHVYSAWPLSYERSGPLPAVAQDAFEDGEGMFIECLQAVCTSDANNNAQAFVKGIETMHAQGKPFLVFASNTRATGWSESFKRTYNFLADRNLWRSDDVIMLINYNGVYAATPETINGEPADTSTGLLYWALHQQPIGTLTPVLVNADTDRDTLRVTRGGEFSFAQVQVSNFSLRLADLPVGTNSVDMTLRYFYNGNLSREIGTRFENQAPYTLFGHVQRDGTALKGRSRPDILGSGVLTPGRYAIDMTAFTSGNGQGMSIAERTVEFTVTE